MPSGNSHHFFRKKYLFPWVFIAKDFFFIVLRHRSWGGPSVSLKKSCFKIHYKKKLIISGDLFFCWNVLVEEFQASRVAAPQRGLCIQKKYPYTWKRPNSFQYAFYLDNSNDFSGMKIWNMSIYVHLCCSMDDILIIQKILVGWKFETCPFMSIYAAVWVKFW